MTTRHLATVYLLAAVVSGTGVWFFAVGTTSAAALAGYSLPTVVMSFGENLVGLLWAILAAIPIAVISWPLVLKYARHHSWVSRLHQEGNAINYANTVFYRLASSFLKNGYTAQELKTVVDAAATKSAVPTTTARPLIPGYIPVYNVVPPELMTVSEVVEKYRITRQAVFGWIRAGHVSEAGLLRYAGSGQRNISLLRRDEVDEWVTMDVDNNIRIYDTLPDGLATLATVEEELGINRRTIRAWILRGHIPKRGLLRGAARRGGMILVSPTDVRRYAESRSTGQNGHARRHEEA